MTLLWQEFQPCAAVATTPTGAKRLQSICQSMGASLWAPAPLADLENVQVYQGSLREHLTTLWSSHQALIFCLATGAVVRLIAPLLHHKSTDPAIIVIDEAGQFVISLCAGHQGGADRLTQAIAKLLKATPVLTGASHHLALPAVDVLGIPFGWVRGDGDWTGVAATIARGETVEVMQEVGSTLWQTHLPKNHPFRFELIKALATSPQPEEIVTEETKPSQLAAESLANETDELLTGNEESLAGNNEAVEEFPTPERSVDEQVDILAELPEETDHSPLTIEAVANFSDRLSPTKISQLQATEFATSQPKGRIWISYTQRRFSPDSTFPKVQWHPRVLWVGIGCERGTSRPLIETAIQQICRANHLAENAIAGLATLDLKADEQGLIELCQGRNWPLKTFSADILRAIPVPNPSEIVEAEVGTPSVAEAAALSACGTSNNLLVPKQIFRLEGQPGAVTVAIAVSPLEYTGRPGKLFLIGTGPGNLEQMTPAAQSAVTLADVVIGYSLYIDLISPLLRPGQIVETFPITQEKDRANRAIELANWGLTVAVVSSGDCGIYGMAGLVLEELQINGWDGERPGVQVFPGISALQAAASLAGAPLMHDFCAISLSDLLTPWNVIEQRLTAAAMADFVIALYNPRSQNRTQQLAQAQKICLQYRSGNTPVAIVRSAYREQEQITLTTLEKLLETSVDMLTTVIIGNQSSRLHHQWMITPRGYLGFAEEGGKGEGEVRPSQNVQEF